MARRKKIAAALGGDVATDAGGRHFYPNDPRWKGYPEDKTAKPHSYDYKHEHWKDPPRRKRRSFYVPGNKDTFRQNA